MWCVWQTMRMVLIAKKQRRARQSAKTLIDFENLIVDTDFGGAISFHMEGESPDSVENDPDEIIEMSNLDEKARLRSKMSVKLGSGMGVQKQHSFERQGLQDGMNAYDIDDEDQPDATANENKEDESI